MTRTMAIYAGTIAFALATAVPSFSQFSPVRVLLRRIRRWEKGLEQAVQRKPRSDKKIDLTGGQQGVPDAYADTPVRQGKLTEVTDSKFKNADVYNTQGEMVGKIKEVLKDKTDE